MWSRHSASCKQPRPSCPDNPWSQTTSISRCHDCVHWGRGSGTFENSLFAQTVTARKSNATEATFTNHALSNPFDEGKFRWVAKGTYTEGIRAGESCVCKWFKAGVVFEFPFFNLDIKVHHTAQHVIETWNANSYIEKPILINIPQVWTFDKDCNGPWAGSMVLQEPFIYNYKKFNSNTGWTNDSTPWDRVIQALSHFSYHASGGKLVLCDLQGGIYSNAIVLTDPAILSVDRSYGVTDLGPTGICSFFSNHKCNEFCSSSWSRPTDQNRYFQPKEGTSMMEVGNNSKRHVARQSRSEHNSIHYLRRIARKRNQKKKKD